MGSSRHIWDVKSDMTWPPTLKVAVWPTVRGSSVTSWVIEYVGVPVLGIVTEEKAPFFSVPRKPPVKSHLHAATSLPSHQLSFPLTTVQIVVCAPSDYQPLDTRLGGPQFSSSRPHAGIVAAGAPARIVLGRMLGSFPPGMAHRLLLSAPTAAIA